MERLSPGTRRGSDDSLATTLTLPFFDIEPNIHFFKLYTSSLDNVEEVLEPRTDRHVQVKVESKEEFIAKVDCLRRAFTQIFEDDENIEYFVAIGKEIIEVLLSHSLQDSSQCLAQLEELLEYVCDEGNHEAMRAEVAVRRIPCINFYDLVIDYIILESFDDSEDPPAGVMSIANNRWLSAGFRELALQTAVSAVLKIKRNKVTVENGFFAHFYNLLDHLSPILAWGFLGTDFDLKLKCNLIKETLETLILHFFSFDHVRYTSLKDLCEDIIRVTDNTYDELRRKLDV